MANRKTPRDKRFAALKSMPCVTCPGCGPTEIHHLNASGRAGQKRRGDEFTIPLGSWAHRGVPLTGKNSSDMEIIFGPSLARSSRKFRSTYGADDVLLAIVNKSLRFL